MPEDIAYKAARKKTFSVDQFHVSVSVFVETIFFLISKVKLSRIKFKNNYNDF